ncbi:MAG: hypothetical protein FWC29_01525 [Methanomassiliicoccaceae archaeon]|nr:hypothetical protein [Methanomassiliicoccaceae archaeon]
MSVLGLGMIVPTAGVKRMMDHDILFRVGVQQALANHSNGDWGDLSENDKKMNDDALKDRKQILSAYNLGATMQRLRF